MRTGRFIHSIVLAATCWGGALLTPCTAQETAPTTTNPWVYTNGLKAAELLPADADSVVVLNTDAELKLSRAIGRKEAPADWAAIKSIAIGVPNSVPACAEAFADAAAPYGRAAVAGIVLPFWNLIANPSIQELQTTIAATLFADIETEADFVQAIRALQDVRLYAVIEFQPGQEAKRRELIAHMENAAKEPDIRYDANGWKGVLVLHKNDLTATPDDKPLPEAIQKALDELQLYIVYQEVGDCLVIACCNNPAELELGNGDTAALQSLPTELAAELAMPYNTPLLAARIDAAALNSLQHLVAHICRALETPLRLTFAAAAASDFHAAADMQKSLESLNAFGAELAKAEQPMQQPLHIGIWHTPEHGNSIRLAAEWDACGAEFSESTLRHTGGIGKPVFCMAASRLTLPNAPDWKVLTRAGAGIINGFMLTMTAPPEDGQTAEMFIGKDFYRILDAFSDLTATIGSTWMLCIEEFQHQGIRETENGPATLCETRSTFTVSLNDRAGFAPACKNFIRTAQEVLNNLFPEEPPTDIITELGMTKRTEGAVTYYETKDQTGTTAIAGDELILCSSRPYGEAIATQERPQTICGLTLQMHLEPILKDSEHREALQPLLDVIGGGALRLTTEEGKFKLYANLSTTTPLNLK